MKKFSIAGMVPFRFQELRKRALLPALLALLGLAGAPLLHAEDYGTNFTWQGGIRNTRHNMSQNTLPAGGNMPMNAARNNYGEVCVYCHTPHGANENIAAPLWNRTVKSNTYVTYDQLGTATLTANVSQPGVSSLTCLSCHDGTVAIDSIINMPGSGSNRYSVAGKTGHQEGFLDGWTTLAGRTTKANAHYAIGKTSPTNASVDGNNVGCMTCHAPSDDPDALLGGVGTDFTVFVTGTDLRNDHPVGIDLPTERVGVDFNEATGTRAKMLYYDNDGDSRPDPSEIRFYKSGGSFRVECASCHDPHGVEGGGGIINASFLRIKNDSSAVCLTCHAL